MATDATSLALLIDADNVDDAVVQRLFAFLDQHKLRATVRRAYGSAESLGTLKDVCKPRAVKFLLNHGRGTMDALLIVDAMDLLHAGALPSLVVIASADADFAPLAIRLRESGRHTLCFAQAEKADREALSRAYDELHLIERPSVAVRAAPATRAERAPSPRAAPAPAPAPRAARKTAAPKPPVDATTAAVTDVLEANDALARGEAVQLNQVVAAMRQAKLLGRTASGPKFLAKHAPFLELTPKLQPNKVRWLR